MTIYCVARNYALHAKELGNQLPSEPVIFIKADTSLRPFDQSEMAYSHETFHYEGEVVLKIGQDTKMGSKATLGRSSTRKGGPARGKREAGGRG